VFFAFPLNDKPDWRKPPWATLLLIALNALVYFGPQAWDRARLEKAADYYFQTELPAIELPRYADYVRERRDRDSLKWSGRIDQALAAKQLAPVFMLMQNDRVFLDKLHASAIIEAGDPAYARWRPLHLRYQELRGTPFTERFSSNPSDFRPWTLLTSMFMHGGAAHLIGNMIFLFVFGYTLEKSIGAGRYLGYYLVAGLGGGALDLAVRWGSHVSALGASGAISGLMAMYVVLYGRRRIKFFYQFLFYFDYVTAPAIILLPLWIAHEMFQQWLGGEGVAYMAHAGGLVTGAVLMWLQKRVKPETQAPPSVLQVDTGAEELARAEALLKQMRVDEARAVYAQLAGRRPADPRVLGPWFNLARHKPESADFHRAASLIAALSGTDDQTAALVLQSYQVYMQSAKPLPKYTPADLSRLALRFARGGQGAEAARLAKLLMDRAPAHADLPRVLLATANALGKKGEAGKAADLYAELKARFPQSDEARMAGAAPRA